MTSQRLDAAMELRHLILDEGGTLVEHDQVPSLYPYSRRPDISAPLLDGTGGHWHGGNSRYHWMEHMFGSKSKTLEASIGNTRAVDDFHMFGRKWSRGFAYGGAICPWTGTFIEMRSFFVTWGAHRGDVDQDGIRANLEKFPIYMSIGGPDRITPALESGYHTVINALKRMGMAELPLDYLKHWEIQGKGSTTCNGPYGGELVDTHRSGGYMFAENAPDGTPTPPSNWLWDNLPIVKQTWPANRLPYDNTRRVQALLAVHGYIDYGPTNFNDNAKPDGLFGPSTKGAVRLFQVDRDLPNTGIVDSEMWQTLVQGAPTIYRNWPDDPSLQRPVQYVQALLAVEGAIPYGPNFNDQAQPDGLWGPSTQQAISLFQDSENLVPLGIEVNWDTWGALLGLSF